MTITYSRHKARKRHRCTPYESKTCFGTGYIEKNQIYYSPIEDSIDPFHPYRICQACKDANPGMLILAFSQDDVRKT
jgi:hypothetical protein